MKTYGKREINWSHRWSVAGHWRTYKGGHRVWVGSYVKGPKDKPFIPSVRVYLGRDWTLKIRTGLIGFWQKFIGWFKS